MTTVKMTAPTSAQFSREVKTGAFRVRKTPRLNIQNTAPSYRFGSPLSEDPPSDQPLLCQRKIMWQRDDGKHESLAQFFHERYGLQRACRTRFGGSSRNAAPC